MNELQYPINPVLIVDDEPHLLQSYNLTLQENGVDNVILCSDSRMVDNYLLEGELELILLDLTMPHLTGQDILQHINAYYPDIPVIIITGTNDIETAVQCMREGAFDYLLKPINNSTLVNSVKRVLQYKELLRENSLLKERILSKELRNPEAFDKFITQNDKMKSIFQYMEAISNTSEPVLITGETGVGKEMISKAFYRLTGAQGEFVAVNVAGLDDQMFTDTLFGHTKGAFTDAVKARPGLIERSSGGVLFLDEIGDLNMASQVKLLRLLQEGEYYPLGSDTPHYTDVKIVLATNKDLFEMQKKGEFRKDLYYRLNVHNISILPLRNRKDDLPLLIEHFLVEAATKMKKKKPTIPYELLTMLSTYNFPGNVRELRSMIFDAVAAHKAGIMSLDSFTQHLEKSKHFKIGDQRKEIGLLDSKILSFTSVLPTLKECQKLLIKEAMKRSDNNQSIAARLLGISRQGLNKRLKLMEEK